MRREERGEASTVGVGPYIYVGPYLVHLGLILRQVGKV